MSKGETFGEISFLQGGKATASVIAQKKRTEIQFIEDNYLYAVFARYPQVAGRFFQYVATILESRLRLREDAVFDSESGHSAE